MWIELIAQVVFWTIAATVDSCLVIMLVRTWGQVKRMEETRILQEYFKQRVPNNWVFFDGVGS